MAEWNIQSRAHACQGCGREFKPGETLHTLLFDARGAYERLDVCQACWESQHAQGSNHRRGFVSHWQGTYDPPPAAEPDPIQKETAETLLRKLIERNDPLHAGAVFILAVMLERKRLLKAKAQTTESGRRMLIYEHARTGDVLTVTDPELQLDQLEAVQRDVATLLEQGLPNADTPNAPPASAPEPPATPERTDPTRLGNAPEPTDAAEPANTATVTATAPGPPSDGP